MNPTTATPRIAGALALGGGTLALWAGLVLLFAAPIALPGAVPWLEAVKFGASFWSLWLGFLPSVAWLAFRFPIERARLVRNLGVHLVACLLIVGCTRFTFRAIGRIFPAPQASARPGRPPEPRASMPGPPNALGVFVGLRAALDALVYGAVVGFCQAITNLRKSQERERRAVELEARFARSQLQALRMQINPHFLFNTLNSIAALVYVNPRAADEMLGDLSGLLRRSLDSMEEHEIPLGRELEFVRAYISIEQRRFGDRLRLEEHVPEDLLNALVPALILQPSVENAIRHGIEPRRGPGVVSIVATREGGRLHLVVRDDGRGASASTPDSTPEGPVRRGVGLNNTQARLRALYGTDQEFTFGPAEPRGCRVDIRLPCHLTPIAPSTAPLPPADVGLA